MVGWWVWGMGMGIWLVGRNEREGRGVWLLFWAWGVLGGFLGGGG